MRSNLTLNYGLRWEVDQPWYDAEGKIQQFIPGQQSTVYPDSPRGWLLPGDKGVPLTLAYTPYRNFAPRLGLAYSPAASEGVLNKIFGGPGKTSIRGAFGIFYTTQDSQGGLWAQGDAPFGDYWGTPTPVYLDRPFKSRFSDNSDPGQRFPFPLPPPNHQISFAPYLPISYSPAYEASNKTPYTEDFNFTVQREVGKTTVLTLGYVSTAGHKLVAQKEFNPGNAALCMHILALGHLQRGGQAAVAAHMGRTGSTPLMVRPFMGLVLIRLLPDVAWPRASWTSGTQAYEATLANSLYNSFQATVNKSAGTPTFPWPLIPGRKPSITARGFMTW